VSQENIYEKLVMQIGAPPSERLRKIWEMLCSEEEAGLLLEMPGTLEDLVEKSGKTPEELKPVLEELFMRGVVFERVKEGVLRYFRPRDLIQFHDASILWPDAPPEFFLLWQAFMENEYVEMIKMIADLDLDAVTRVIPVEQSMEGGGSKVLPLESAVGILESASRLAVTKCTCRLTANKCDSPQEVCIQLDRAADYALKRGTGKEISVEEGREILRKSADAGLVHVTDNRASHGHIICNCCSCCCIVLPIILRTRKRVLLAPSRFLPAVDVESCTLCSTCLEACPVDALSLENEGGEEAVQVDQDLCLGCGQCAYQCPEEAIAMKEVRNPDFIPGAAAC
jgi:NAD-dependent dihydropyrimidine dehydrogenase PreA subunit